MTARPMSISAVDSMPIVNADHVVLVRQAVRQKAVEIGFSLVDQTKMVTAASELARNALIHGGGGRMHWAVREEGIRRGLQLRFEDEGPGIADLQLAMSDGYTSGGGMGLGLPGSKRLVSEFDLRSTPGQGTCVSIVKWK